MIGQAISAHTDATHGMTLAAVSLPYYRMIMSCGIKKFARFAVNVWGVSLSGKSDSEAAEEGLRCMEKWMKDIGLVMNAKDLGVTSDMLGRIADSTLIMNGGYKVLTREDVIKVLEESLKYE